MHVLLNYVGKKTARGHTYASKYCAYFVTQPPILYVDELSSISLVNKNEITSLTSPQSLSLCFSFLLPKFKYFNKKNSQID